MTREEAIENTPTVDTTTKRTEKHTETHTCDYISRQAAIDTIEERIKANGYGNVALVSELNRLYGYIRRLPSAQPDIILSELERYCTWSKTFENLVRKG